jgi:hypothetical protein
MIRNHNYIWKVPSLCHVISPKKENDSHRFYLHCTEYTRPWAMWITVGDSEIAGRRARQGLAIWDRWGNKWPSAGACGHCWPQKKWFRKRSGPSLGVCSWLLSITAPAFPSVWHILSENTKEWKSWLGDMASEEKHLATWLPTQLWFILILGATHHRCGWGGSLLLQLMGRKPCLPPITLRMAMAQTQQVRQEHMCETVWLDSWGTHLQLTVSKQRHRPHTQRTGYSCRWHKCRSPGIMTDTHHTHPRTKREVCCDQGCYCPLTFFCPPLFCGVNTGVLNCDCQAGALQDEPCLQPFLL